MTNNWQKRCPSEVATAERPEESSAVPRIRGGMAQKIIIILGEQTLLQYTVMTILLNNILQLNERRFNFYYFDVIEVFGFKLRRVNNIDIFFADCIAHICIFFKHMYL